MLRNIVGSWLLAAFLVVVAVATWRLLDVNRSSCPSHASCPHAHAVVAAPELAPVDEPPVAHTCGAGAAAYEPPPPPEPTPEPTPVAHTCGAGADVPNEPVQANEPVTHHDPFNHGALLTDAQAETLFQQAVEDLRMKKNAEGCAKLEHLVDVTPGESRWVEKSVNLFNRRCGD